MELATPWALLLLLLIPFVWILHRRMCKTPSLRFSSSETFVGCPQSWRIKLRELPFYLRLVALTLLVIALARPRLGIEKVIDHSKGVAIEMVLDRSGSMAEEMPYRGQKADRLEVAKQVFNDFVIGGDGLQGRPNDLVGLITFARYADTICPLTLGHEALPQFLKQVKLVQLESEDGTAIGDAVALAAARLHKAEEEINKREGRNPEEKGFSIKSKVIILLTDGQDNASRTGIAKAAQLCKDWGIKIYAIGIGDENGNGFINTPLGRMPVPGGVGGVDVRTLKYLAQMSGGKFYLADNEKSLKEVYENIDTLEKSEIASVRHVDYAEKFMSFAICALILIGLEILLSSTVLRKLP